MRSTHTNAESPTKESSSSSPETEGLSPIEAPTDSSTHLSFFQKFQHKTRNTARKVNNQLQQQNAFDWIEKEKDGKGGFLLAANFDDSSYTSLEHEKLLKIKLGGIISALPPSELGNATFRNEVLQKNGLTEEVHTRILAIEDNFPFEKKHFPDIREALEFSRKLRNNGKNVLVHCRVGIGRSATIVLMDRMQKKSLRAKEALLELKKKRSQASPNPSQILSACEYVFWEQTINSGKRLVRTFQDFYETVHEKYQQELPHNEKSLKSFPDHLQYLIDGAKFILRSDQANEFERELPSFFHHLFEMAKLHSDPSQLLSAKEFKLSLEQEKFISEKNQHSSSSEAPKPESPPKTSSTQKILKRFNRLSENLRQQFEHVLNIGQLPELLAFSSQLEKLLDNAKTILQNHALDFGQAKELHANLLETSNMIGALLYLHSKMMEKKYPDEIANLEKMNDSLRTMTQEIDAIKKAEADAVLEKLIEATTASIKKFNEYTKHKFLHASKNLETVNAWKDTFTTKLGELQALKAKKNDPDFNLGKIEAIQKEMLTSVSLDSDIILILKDDPSEQELKAKYETDKKPILIKNSRGEISIYGISEEGTLKISPLNSEPFKELVFNEVYSERKSFDINKEMREEIRKGHDPKYSRNPIMRLLLEIQEIFKYVFDIGRSKRNQSQICISNLQRALSSSVTKNCENINAFFKIPSISQPAAEPANQMPAPEV